MTQSQNIIHSSAFNFEYENKASALRSNVLIESIFHSHILPEIEQAISNKIPEGVLIELAKLEINIGTIAENDLSNNLAERIRVSLEKALDFKLNISTGINGGSQEFKKNSKNYLISTLEIFLTKGYFPYAVDSQHSIDDLVAEANQNYTEEFTAVLKMHHNHDDVIRRAAFNFEQKTFDNIIFSLEPVNAAWITEFKAVLLKLKKELNLNHLTDAAFTQMINYTVLKFLLNDTSSAFSTKRFAAGILSGMDDSFQFISQHLTKPAQKIAGKSPITALIDETLVGLQKEQLIFPIKNIEQKLSLEQLIKILNAGNTDLSISRHNFLKREITGAILNNKKREQLIKGLSETGAIFILELLDKNKAADIFKLIHSFIEEVVCEMGTTIAKPQAVNKIALQSALYLQENAVRNLNKEEFILFLIYSAKPDESKIASSSVFQKFIENPENGSLKKMISAINDEQQFHEISDIHHVLTSTHEQQDLQRDLNPNPTALGELLTIYKRKIALYFLDSGRLPTIYSILSWHDVQQIFIELLEQKDDFLAKYFKKIKSKQQLVPRLNLLANGQWPDILREYLIHFFPGEYSILLKTVTEITENFTLHSNLIYTISLTDEIFVQALSESQGGRLPGVFMLTVSECFYFKLAGETSEADQLFHFLALKSGGEKNQDNLPNPVFEIQVKNKIEREFILLVRKMNFADFSFKMAENETERRIKKLAFYFSLHPQAFLNAIQKHRADLAGITILFRFYLLPAQWKQIEKTLSARSEISDELKKWKAHSEIVVQKMAFPESNLVEMFNIAFESGTKTLKTFTSLILSEKSLFGKFISESNFIEAANKLPFENATFQKHLEQLMAFSPETLNSRLDKKFWKTTVLHFAFSVFANEKGYTPANFADKFFSHLIKNLKSVQQENAFFPIVESMISRGSAEVRELAEVWQKPEKKTVIEFEKTDEAEITKEVSKDLDFYVSALAFYAQNKFFPWWGGQISIPELLDELSKFSHLQSDKFEEKILLAEKEAPFFTLLTEKLPAVAKNKLDAILARHPALKEICETAIQQDKKNGGSEKTGAKIDGKKPDIDNFIKEASKNSAILFKGIYRWTDEQILNRWLKNSPQIANQIREYLSIAPCFYSRNVTPPKWRQAVFGFALDYYREETRIMKDQFHREFLTHLKKQHSSVNWTEILTSVCLVVQSPHLIKKNVSFPPALVPLLNIVPASGAVKSNSEKMENHVLPDEETGIQTKIYNAGMVLLWPFLTRLFEHLSRIKNGAFINRESMNRAAYILQYLVYNEINFPEYELLLNKLLVGMQPGMHLEPFVTLTDDEKNMTQSLLNGLISNWEKVKNSTPEGIQETFLQREGILMIKEDEVLLKVEKKGVDVLLESIPWNFTVIKLSWMTKPIHVEWK